MPQRNEIQTNTKATLGTATLLPRRAAEYLQQAAEETKALPPESMRRRQVIDKAIILVKREFPEFFFR